MPLWQRKQRVLWEVILSAQQWLDTSVVLGAVRASQYKGDRDLLGQSMKDNKDN